MLSLYGNLFRYRESELRSPREDYLSECLADFFNRLPSEIQSAFVSRILIPDVLLAAFATVVAEVASFRLETQRQIGSGRIDIVLLADDVPIVAIENKISAPFQDDQLASYGRWIKAAARSHRLAIVCLLTHLTSPPPGFMSGGEASGKATPHLVRWSSIAGLLLELAVSAEVRDDVKLLAREFRRFLEENDMSTEYAGRDEFAAALVYLRAGAQMDHTFGSIFTHVKEKDGAFAKNETKNEYHLKFDTPYKLIWGWTYLAHAKFDGLLFGYGISLEPNTVFTSGGISTQSPIPATDSAFICVGADNKRSIQAVRAVKSEPAKPWTYAEIGKWVAVISFKPLHDVMEKPQSFAQEMIRWIDRETDSVNQFVAALK
jgi:hypothetical protein